MIDDQRANKLFYNLYYSFNNFALCVFCFLAEEAGSDNLLKVTLGLVSHAPCNESFFDGDNSAQLALGIVDEWQICAGELGKDTCQVIYLFLLLESRILI